MAAAIAASLAACTSGGSKSSSYRTDESASNANSNSAPSAKQNEQAAPAAGGSASVQTQQSRVPAPGPVLPPQPGGAYFKNYGTNPFIATEDDKLSTFAMDVDTGSYTVARNYIGQGTLPPEEAVRAEEFVNYFRMEYPAPENGAFAILVDGGDSPFRSGYKLMRVGIKGKEIGTEERKDANLTFVIDVSGSMGQENRLELVKKSLKLLVDQLGPSDQIGIVTFGSTAKRVLDQTMMKHKDRIVAAIDRLRTEGATNAEQGLKLGYEMAQEFYKKDAANTIILCSDGVANVGAASAKTLLQSVQDYARKGITLQSVGFGMGDYNDTLMEQLADKGDGRYAYVDSFTEARRLFADELIGTVQTIARDAKVQVEFDPAKVDRYRLIGYENRDVKDSDFRNDAIDAGEIGAGHSVTALYEVKLKNGDGSFGEVRLRYMDAALNKVVEQAAPLKLGATLTANTKFLAAVAEYAEIMRGSYWAKDVSLRTVLPVAEQAASGEQQLDFVRLLKDTLALRKE
ncbi:MAG: von Willebrand factor type A domain-containing protein [Paenibacillaceae bacterium]|nr:von Willebrand factor type A domain-containing protein [Paenibacillaceae bacterium]